MARRGGMSQASSKIVWWKLQDAAEQLAGRMHKSHPHRLGMDDVYNAFVDPAHVREFERVKELGFINKGGTKSYYHDINTEIELNVAGYKVTFDVDTRPVPSNALNEVPLGTPMMQQLVSWLDVQYEIEQQWMFVKKVLIALAVNGSIKTVAQLRSVMSGALVLLETSGAASVGELREYVPPRTNITIPMNLARACQRASTIIASSQLVEPQPHDKLAITWKREGLNPLIKEYGL
jgi:hypothetical protein